MGRKTCLQLPLLHDNAPGLDKPEPTPVIIADQSQAICCERQTPADPGTATQGQQARQLHATYHCGPATPLTFTCP